MDELIKQGQWWWLLVVPVATGGLALFGSWWGSRLGKTTEHEQWLRNEKIETYSHYVETVRRGDLEVRKLILGAITVADALKSTEHTGGSRLRLIAPKSVRDAAEAHMATRREMLDLKHSKTPEYQETASRLDEARKLLVDAMSRDLGIADHG